MEDKNRDVIDELRALAVVVASQDVSSFADRREIRRELRNEVDTAAASQEEAIEEAVHALEQADAALSAALEATQEIANTALSHADAAQTTANAALEKANTAIEVAQAAVEAITHFSIRSHTVYLSQFGCDYTDLTGVKNRNAFIAAKDHIKSIGGGEIIVPGEKLWMSGYVSDRSLKVDMDIVGKPGNRIVGVQGITYALFGFFTKIIYYQVAMPLSGMQPGDLWFDRAVTDPILGQGHIWDGTAWVAGPYFGEHIIEDVTLRTSNLNVDLSRGVDSGGGQYASAFVAGYFRNWYMDECRGFGGTVYNNVSADSFASPISCFNFQARDNDIEGFNDCAYYVGGDNKKGATAGDGFTAKIDGGTAIACAQAVAAKRELYHCVVTNMTTRHCRIGVVSLPVGAGLAGVGRRLKVSDNTFINTESRVFELRGDTAGEFTNNLCDGWGVDVINGGTIPGSAAVNLIGGRGAVIRGNTFARGGVPLDGQIGIVSSYGTIDGVTYPGGEHMVEGNNYRDLALAVVEAPGVAASSYKGETLSGMSAATPFLLTNPNSGGHFTRSGNKTVYIL